MPADRRPWDPGSPALARLPFLLRAAREADRDGRLRRRLGRLLTDAGAVLSQGQPKARRSCGRPVGEHRAPRSAARLLPGPCPALPARPAALVARRRLHARSALPARPAALSALPAPLGAPAPFSHAAGSPRPGNRPARKRAAGRWRLALLQRRSPDRAEGAGRRPREERRRAPRSAPRLPARPGIVRDPPPRLSAHSLRCWEGCGPGRRAHSA